MILYEFISFLFCDRQDDYVMLMVLIKKLTCLSRLEELITNACDTSFLYWHKLILPVYFEQLFKGKTEAYRLNVSFWPFSLSLVMDRVLEKIRVFGNLEFIFQSEELYQPIYLEIDFRYYPNNPFF